MDKTVKKYLNALKCPLCKSPLDILPETISRKGKINVTRVEYPYNYGCATHNNHYLVSLDEKTDNNPFFTVLKEEQVNIYSYPNFYKISQNHWFAGTSDTTHIMIRKINRENSILDDIPPKYLKYDKILFDFKKLTQDKIVNKINTLIIFK